MARTECGSSTGKLHIELEIVMPDRCFPFSLENRSPLYTNAMQPSTVAHFTSLKRINYTHHLTQSRKK